MCIQSAQHNAAPNSVGTVRCCCHTNNHQALTALSPAGRAYQFLHLYQWKNNHIWQTSISSFAATCYTVRNIFLTLAATRQTPAGPLETSLIDSMVSMRRTRTPLVLPNDYLVGGGKWVLEPKAEHPEILAADLPVAKKRDAEPLSTLLLHASLPPPLNAPISIVRMNKDDPIIRVANNPNPAKVVINSLAGNSA